MSDSLAPVTQTLLQDDFATDPAGPVNASLWDYNHWSANNNPSYYGRTQIQQSLPAVANGALQLTLQTYNPTGPGQSFVGSEIISNQLFNDTGGGIAFTAVAKLDTTIPGLVGGVFGYNYNPTTQLDNEVDFESLTNDAASQPNQEQTNIYGNQPLGAGNPEFVPEPSLTTYQTYTMEWFPNEVLWLIDGHMVRETTANIPLGPLAFHLNFWAPDTDWSAAYSAALQPTADPQDNTTYTFDVQSVTVAEIACFAAGTRIATPAGERAIETLAKGDLVLTASGAEVPIIFNGHRRLDCRHHPRPAAVWPVRVCRDALGIGRPHRSVWLSPDHAVFLDGVLIPIRCLVNDRSIRQERRDAISYWHIELPQHDIVLAEGLPAESYLDTGNRGAFDNAEGPTDLHPDFARRVWEAQACAEQILGGPPLVLARRRVQAQANLLRPAPATARRTRKSKANG